VSAVALSFCSAASFAKTARGKPAASAESVAALAVFKKSRRENEAGRFMVEICRNGQFLVHPEYGWVNSGFAWDNSFRLILWTRAIFVRCHPFHRVALPVRSRGVLRYFIFFFFFWYLIFIFFNFFILFFYIFFFLMLFQPKRLSKRTPE